MSSAEFTEFEPAAIGGIVKKYLRELANPVIPVEQYDNFINAASKLHAMILYSPFLYYFIGSYIVSYI